LPLLRSGHSIGSTPFEEEKTFSRAELRLDPTRKLKIQPMQESTVLEKPATNQIQLDKIVTSVVLAAIVVSALLGTASAQNVSTPAFSAQTLTTGVSPNSIRAGHILARFKANPSQAVLDGLNTAYGAKVVGKIAALGITHLQVSPELGLATLGHLRNRPDVEFAEFDSPVQAFQTFAPDDTYYSASYASSHYGSIAQWGPQAVSAPAAWGVTPGDPSIVIAIVDTGIDSSHPDLASKVVGEYSVIGKSARDGFGHGTHVAGIAAAATNNDIGIAGMCPNCSILSVKVLDDNGSGYLSDVASGITYAAAHGARVINLSLGGSTVSQTMRSALAYAVANNALPVCAAGNANSSTAPEPAYWYDCLSVIATDQNGARASFSNYGVVDDVAAPGVAILSTMPTYGVTLNSYGYLNNYDALSGTSMATPAVAGIAGLVLSRNPNLSPAQVRGIIEAAAGDGASWTPDLGFGVVNAANAVSLAIHSDNIAPTANLISPAAGATVSGLVTVQADPTDNSGVHQVDLVKDGTRFIQPLVSVATATTTSAGRHKSTSTTTPAWTTYWASTTTFNTGSVSLSVVASDIFGNSASTTRSFAIQNRLISQSWTQSLCLPATSSCPNSILFPVTTGVATQAATHLQGTISYGSSKNVSASTFWLKVFGSTAAGSFLYSCGITNGTTVDCYPPSPFDLYPDTKGYANYSGAQIDSTVNQAATVQWTVTYPQ
jgi:thermitase